MNAVAEPLGEDTPIGPVAFGEAVFNGNYWVVVDNPSIPVDQIVGGFPVTIGFEDVVVLVLEFGGGNIHGDGNVGA